MAGLAERASIRHNGVGGNAISNLIIEMPDDLVRSLEEIAAAQHKSVQQLAVEQLRSLAETSPEDRLGSAAALLRAMRDTPHPSKSDVDELDAAVAAARVPVQPGDLFSE
jgi:hypothetical protein